METVFALQGPHNMFGGGFDKDAEEDLRRFSLGMGFSATISAAKRRRNAGPPRASPRGPQGLEELCALGHRFFRRYWCDESVVDWNHEAMERIISSKEDDDSDDKEQLVILVHGHL